MSITRGRGLRVALVITLQGTITGLLFYYCLLEQLLLETVFTVIFDELFCEDAQAVTEEIRLYKNKMHSLLIESIYMYYWTYRLQLTLKTTVAPI